MRRTIRTWYLIAAVAVSLFLLRRTIRVGALLMRLRRPQFALQDRYLAELAELKEPKELRDAPAA